MVSKLQRKKVRQKILTLKDRNKLLEATEKWVIDMKDSYTKHETIEVPLSWVKQFQIDFEEYLKQEGLHSTLRGVDVSAVFYEHYLHSILFQVRHLDTHEQSENNKHTPSTEETVV